jgi:hypothetical protein
VVSFTPLPLYPWRKSPLYPLDRRLGGPQSRSGRYGEVKNSLPYWDSNSDPSIVQPVASRYTVVCVTYLKLLLLILPVGTEENDETNPAYLPIGLWCRGSTLSRQSAHRWRRGCQPYALDALYPPETFFYSGGSRLELRPDRCLSWRRLFLIFLSPPCNCQFGTCNYITTTSLHYPIHDSLPCGHLTPKFRVFLF